MVEVRDLAKRFATDLQAARSYAVRSVAQELSGRQPRERPALRDHEFWALQDITFDLPKGHAIGIVGANGAGKTSLLRILHGISAPDWGTVTIRGRSAAVIELGNSFDELATGREAIAAEGAVLGLAPDRLKDLEEEIIGFAELQAVIDAPVRTYSQGMRLRLGYAVAAHTQPDLLLVDELLAVGDAAFQRKCIGFILRYLDDGGSLILVSHDMWQVRAVASRCLVLDRGRIVADGEVQQALRTYMEQSVAASTARAALDLADQAGPLVDDGDAVVRILGGSLADPDGDPVVTGGPAVLSLDVDNQGPAVDVRCIASLGSVESPAIAVAVESPADPLLTLPEGRSTIRHHLDRLDLIGASYALRAALVDADDTQLASIGWTGMPLTVALQERPGEDQTPHRMIGALSVLLPRWPDELAAEAAGPADTDPSTGTGTGTGPILG